MSTHKTIAVAIDYSTPSINALKDAARIAKARDLKVICFHVFDQDIFNDFHEGASCDSAEALVLAHKNLEDFIREHIGEECDSQAVVKMGNPFEEIIRTIQEFKPRTLVLGSHGSKTPYLEQVGPLAARCIRMAPVEVLLVRDAHNKPFRSIGACIDFSENSIRAAHRAAEIAVQDGAKLQLVHIYRPPFYANSKIGWLSAAFPKVDEAGVQQSKEEQLQKLREELVAKYGLEEISTVVQQADHIARALYDVLREVDTDLVVLGTRGRTGLKGIFLGTTAESLINTTPCSTLTVKPKDFTYEL